MRNRTAFSRLTAKGSDEQKWIKSFFIVDTSSNAEIIKAAAKRQKLRTGFSDWEYEHGDHKQPHDRLSSFTANAAVMLLGGTDGVSNPGGIASYSHCK